MVVRKHVPPLEKLVLKACTGLILERCGHLATRISSQQAGPKGPTLGDGETMQISPGMESQKCQILSSEERQQIVQQFVDRLKSYLWKNVVWYLYKPMVAAILEGVIAAVEAKKSNWELGTNMPEFTLQVWAMIKVADLIHIRNLQELEIDSMPKMIRSNVLRNLDKFPCLKKLDLGSNCGSSERTGRAVARMAGLESFSLRYNCTREILEALTHARQTLKILDIEHSRLITDECLPVILEFKNLTELSISKTSLTEESQAEIILKLPKLELLPRGDYLCEALEWIAWEGMHEANPYPVFHIRNFWASEVYFFHTTEQMSLVVQMCPHVQQMLFMYQDRFTCPISVLGNFKYLKDLELWGGDFYSDSFEDLLASLGQTLIRLDLHHVERIDEKAIALLSFHCTRLEYLGFSGCDMTDYNFNSSGDSEVDELNSQLNIRRHDECKAIMQPFLELKHLSVSCPCPSNLLIALMSLAVNTRKLVLGINCGVTDQIFSTVFTLNKFQYLEELEIRKSDFLTMKTVSNLLFHCDKIKSILDLTAWSRVSRVELEELDDHMRRNNTELRLWEDLGRHVSLYEICQSQLKERYQPVEWFGDE